MNTQFMSLIGSQGPSVEMLHSPTNAKPSNGNNRSDYTNSVGCKGVGCRNHVSGIHTPKVSIVAKSNAMVTF